MVEGLNTLSICLVGPIPPPAGGMANQTRQLKALLEQEGATVHLVAVNAPYKPAFIAKVPGLRALFRLVPYLVNLYHTIGKSQVVHIMANSGWSWHLFAAPAIWISRLRNKPVIVNYRGGHAEQFFAKSWRKVNASLRYCSEILVPSSFLQDIFAKYGKDSAIVPNILDHTLFYPQADKNHHYGNLNRPHLIITRNLEEIYDVETAINAFANVKQHYPYAHLTVAGSGPLLDALQKQTADLNISDSVTFSGRLNSNEMAALYRSADIMLNSSVVDNSPNSLIEAMACKVPVISTNVGGIPKLVSDKVDAFLVAPKDHHAMAFYAKQVLSSPELRERLVENGLQNSNRFHWRLVSQLLAAHYRRAIDKQDAK